MEEETKPSLPEQIEEVDALRLKLFDKDKEALQLQAKLLDAEETAFHAKLAAKYQLALGKDQVDQKTLKIIRG